MATYAISRAHTCDGCGRVISDRDEIACPDCKAGIAARRYGYAWAAHNPGRQFDDGHARSMMDRAEREGFIPGGVSFAIFSAGFAAGVRSYRTHG